MGNQIGGWVCEQSKNSQEQGAGFQKFFQRTFDPEAKNVIRSFPQVLSLVSTVNVCPLHTYYIEPSNQLRAFLSVMMMIIPRSRGKATLNGAYDEKPSHSSSLSLSIVGPPFLLSAPLSCGHVLWPCFSLAL